MVEECHLSPGTTLSSAEQEYGRAGELGCAFLPMRFLGAEDSFRILFLGFPSFPVSLPHLFLESLPNKLPTARIYFCRKLRPTEILASF